jgi:hypothetical protein
MAEAQVRRGELSSKRARSRAPAPALPSALRCPPADVARPVPNFFQRIELLGCGVRGRDDGAAGIVVHGDQALADQAQSVYVVDGIVERNFEIEQLDAHVIEDATR